MISEDGKVQEQEFQTIPCMDFCACEKFIMKDGRVHCVLALAREPTLDGNSAEGRNIVV